MTRIVFNAAAFIFTIFIQSWAFAAGVDHVIVISIDGGKPASIYKSNMPILKNLVTEGASTFSAQTIFPSKTLPSHVSMLTGVGPDTHKVLWNNWNPAKGTVKVPTVFGVVKSQGFSTALFATKDKFKHLEVSGTLDKFSLEENNAIDVAKEASDYLDSNKPNLLFIHMPDADVAGHAFGWESRQQLRALENVDTAIGIVVQTIKKSLAGKTFALIITADHGGSGRDHGSSLPADMIIPWISWGNVVKKDHKILKSVNTVDTAATVLWLMDIAVPSSFEGLAVEEAYQ